MISLRVRPGSARRPVRTYDLAGSRVITDVEHEALSAFEVPGFRPAGESALPEPRILAGRPLFDGEAWMAGDRRRLVCRGDGGGYRLEVSGVGVFRVAPGGAVRAVALARAVSARRLAEAVLGAPLILALGLRGTFCFHAAAVARGDRAIGLLGVSGAGKSTLASRLPQLDDWRRVADDILPIRCATGSFFALPRFPQLKLSASEQAAEAGDHRLRLAAVYVLARPASAAGGPAIRPLRGPMAIGALTSHTVAARLFAPSLLSRHLAFCADLAAIVPIRGLEFPRRFGALAAVAAAIDADLRRHDAGDAGRSGAAAGGR